MMQGASILQGETCLQLLWKEKEKMKTKIFSIG
jgi:hypothetical protein